MALSVAAIEDVARTMLDMQEEARHDDKAFRSFFGALTSIIARIWNVIHGKGDVDRGAHPKHLLWALPFMKCCAPTPVLCRVCGWPDEKTCWKWC